MAAGGLAASFTGCERLVVEANAWLGNGLPDKASPSADRDIDPGFHLLSRAGFGPRPGDLERLNAMGHSAWIEEQLEPASIADTGCDLRAERFESLYFSAGDAYEFRKPVLRKEITKHALLRAVYSKRQLFEAMVEFWTDHLNIDLEKGDCIYLKPSDDRDVVRKFALGRFCELIRASATSPAMLVYLDGKANKVRKNTADKPNENYARELMELHTLGVHNFYTQKDIVEAARCLSGWTFDPKRVFALNQGESYFRADWHDDGPKTILGVEIAAGGGASDIDSLVRILCSHPGTARFISKKLCAHFVDHSPPDSLVTRVADTFASTGGDIKSLLRVVLNSEEFASSRGQMLKRPFKFLVSALRATAAETTAEDGILEPLHRMGHGLFQYPTPNGYPEEELPWMGTLMWRWNFALALAANKQPAAKVSLPPLARALGAGPGMEALDPARWFSHCVGRIPSPAELEALHLVLQTPPQTVPSGPTPSKKGSPHAGTDARLQSERALGLVLASPAFQRC